MPKKCESCKFYLSETDAPKPFGNRCVNTEVRYRVEPDFVFIDKYIELDAARDICDREGDGIFVYFEPKTPSAGSTFADAGCASPRVSKGGTPKPGPPQLAMRAAAGGTR